MNDDDRAQWSRHYDYMQWVAITIFTTILAGLLAYSIEHKNLWLSVFGLLLTNATLWFTAGFRWFRRYIVLRVQDDELARLLTGGSNDRPLSMWPIFVVMFALINALWVKTLLSTIGTEFVLCLTLIVSLLILLFLLYTYHVGRGLTYQQWLESKSIKNTSSEVAGG